MDGVSDARKTIAFIWHYNTQAAITWLQQVVVVVVVVVPSDCDHACTISLQFGNHTTPLQLACLQNHGDTVDVLLDHGADIEQFSEVSQLGK